MYNRIMIDTAVRDLKLDYTNPVIKAAIDDLEKDMAVFPWLQSESEIRSYLVGFSKGAFYSSQQILNV